VELRVATWNVWFDSLALADRAVALVGELLDHAPQVVCLQEVTPDLAMALRGFPALLEHYAVSPTDVGSYGCLLLVHSSLQPCTFDERPLPSDMDRSLVTASLPGALVVATVHLESLDSERARQRQLQVIAEHLKPWSRAVLCGDFNFDASRTFGDWFRPAPKYGPDELENAKMKRTLVGYEDAWEALHGSDDPGYTFDGETNPACIRNRAERMRYDRVMVRGLRPRTVRLLGLTAIDESGIKPSDHYGLVVDLAAPLPPRQEDVIGSGAAAGADEGDTSSTQEGP